nr:oleate hydratase [Sphingomonas sp. Ant H11]
MASGRKAYLVGGGIGSLAAAAFLIRDGGLKGSDITVYEMLPILGGSLDGAAAHRMAIRCAAAGC